MEVQPLSSASVKVSWRSVLPGQRNGQIRGYQLHYALMENEQSRGVAHIKDIMLDEQHRHFTLSSLHISVYLMMLGAVREL